MGEYSLGVYPAHVIDPLRPQIPESMALTIQLLGKEDLTLDDAYGSEEKMHASWVSSYALTSSTEGVGAQVKAPLLKR